MKSLHIALLISSLRPGGAEKALTELANYLQKQGHKISLITLEKQGEQPFYPLHNQVSLYQLNQENHRATSFTNRLFNIFKRIQAVRQSLKKLKPDVALSFVDMMNLTTLLAVIDIKIPVICAERTHPAYHQLPSLYKKLRSLLYPKAAAIIVQTASAGSYFKKLKNLIVIPNAIKSPLLTKEEVSIKAPVKNIISVGRLCPYKGFKTLIEAFARLSAVSPQLLLTIYGEGAERKNLEALIQKLDLSHKVFLPGTTKDIEKALLEGDLFVFPSQYEGFPNALCEAMAVGLPVIASKCSGNIDIVRDHVDGRLFQVGDVEELARVMKELLENPQERLTLSKNARQITERFSAEVVCQQWDELLFKVRRKN